MLEEIRIRGLGVIDDAQLELDPGFTVVTGETGAGKTMVVTGLSLLLGGRADAGLIRPEAGRAVVEGRIRVDASAGGPAGAAARAAEEAGAELDDGALIIVRALSDQGRSRAHLGGTGVPVRLLSEVTDELVALHGQSEQLQLLRPARQRELLDRYAGEPVERPLTRYRTLYERMLAITAELDELVARARERVREADAVRYGLSEIDAVAPVAGEDEELAAEESRLAHADALRAAAEKAWSALAGDEDPGAGSVDALSAVSGAQKELDAVRQHDPALAGLSDRLAEAAVLLGDVAAELASYGAGVETDPVRLATVSERRAALTGLTRKYGDTVAEVLAWAESARERLTELDSSDERVQELNRERAALLSELGTLAGEVSSARRRAAEEFGTAVTAELSALAMPDATVSVDVRQAPGNEEAAEPGPTIPQGEAIPDDEAIPGPAAGAWLTVGDRRLTYGPHGVDEVELRLCPYPGAPARPVQRAASGGELSRVMLAVEVVLAGVDRVPTFVFDEVDAGVAGKAAVEIGRRLARLARHAQVVVVTHLPQVAAFADRHYVVRKSTEDAVTRSGLVRLEDADRVDELARMLAGLDDSASARSHARELLTSAADERTAMDPGATPSDTASSDAASATGGKSPTARTRTSKTSGSTNGKSNKAASARSSSR